MTRDEAIDWLARVKSNTVNHTLEMPLWWNEPLAEALDMAIKVIEQEPCEDAISRQAVFEQINCWIGSGEYKYTNATYYLTKRMQGLPSVTPQPQKWIPCSERLPEDRELVLCSSKMGGVFEGRYFDDETDYQWYAFRNDEFVRNDVIDAWMPLPKPYKEESEVKE